jgi:hypothetical protein
MKAGQKVRKPESEKVRELATAAGLLAHSPTGFLPHMEVGEKARKPESERGNQFAPASDPLAHSPADFLSSSFDEFNQLPIHQPYEH